jgi:hypothetical protein
MISTNGICIACVLKGEGEEEKKEKEERGRRGGEGRGGEEILFRICHFCKTSHCHIGHGPRFLAHVSLGCFDTLTLPIVHRQEDSDLEKQGSLCLVIISGSLTHCFTLEQK